MSLFYRFKRDPTGVEGPSGRWVKGLNGTLYSGPPLISTKGGPAYGGNKRREHAGLPSPVYGRGDGGERVVSPLAYAEGDPYT